MCYYFEKTFLGHSQCPLNYHPDAQVDVRPGHGEPPVHGGGTADPQLVPVARLHAAPLEGVSKLAAATAGPAGLGPVAHDGAHRLRGGHARLPPTPGTTIFRAAVRYHHGPQKRALL